MRWHAARGSDWQVRRREAKESQEDDAAAMAIVAQPEHEDVDKAAAEKAKAEEERFAAEIAALCEGIDFDAPISDSSDVEAVDVEVRTTTEGRSGDGESVAEDVVLIPKAEPEASDGETKPEGPVVRGYLSRASSTNSHLLQVRNPPCDRCAKRGEPCVGNAAGSCFSCRKGHLVCKFARPTGRNKASTFPSFPALQTF